MPVAAIAFTPAPRQESPNMRPGTSDSAAATYYEAMIVAFASYRRWMPEAHLRLITDVGIPPRFEAAYAELGVAVLMVPFAHRPPPGFTSRFAASLYTIDALRVLVEDYPAEPIALLDPDCLAVRPLGELFGRAANRVCAYPRALAPDQDVNGLTALRAETLHQELDDQLTGLPQTYGGECYAFTTATMSPILDQAERAFRHTIDRLPEAPRFVTEEHVLNFALRYADVDEIDDLLKRIWTAPRLRTVDGNELRLALWHLPAEKDRGFRGMLEVVADRRSWFWTAPDDEFRARLGRRVGVTRRPPRRWLYDTTGRTVRLSQRMMRPRGRAQALSRR